MEVNPMVYKRSKMKKQGIQKMTLLANFKSFTFYIKTSSGHLIEVWYLLNKPDIGLAVRVFANGPGDLGSIPGRVIPKIKKMVLDASLLNTQHYKVRIKGKVEQLKERSSALLSTLV